MKILNKIKPYFPYLIVIFGIIINVLMWQRYYTPESNLTSGDQGYYHSLAQAVAEGSTTRDNGSDIGAVIMPGYPAIVGSIYKTFGQNVNYIYILQVIASIVAALLVYKIMKHRTNALIALLVAGWLLAYYPLGRMSFALLKESLTASLFIFTLYFFHKYLLTKKNNYFIIFAIIWAVLIPVMNRFIVHFGFISILILYLSYKKEFKYEKFFILIGIAFITLVPWHIRQYLKFDELVAFSPRRSEQVKMDDTGNDKKTADDSSKFKSYEAYKTGIMNSGFNEARKQYFKNHFTLEKFEKMKANYDAFEGFNQYWSRFLGFFEIYNSDFRFGFGGDIRITPPPSKIRKYTDLLLLAPMFVFMLVGLFFSVKKKDYFFIFIFLTILAHVLLHTYVHYIPRYRVTIIPAIFMMGWYGIYNCISYMRNFKGISIKRD
jgi:hypothetical protein